jgi:hypothetical protein
MKNRYVSITRLSVFILLSLFLVALPVSTVHAQDIFGFVTYDYNSFFHIQSYHPANPNGVAVILVPGGGPSYPYYWLQPPKMHSDYPVFIYNLTTRGYIVLMPYSDSSESLDDWNTFLDFTINMTVHNSKIKRTIVVAHSAGGVVAFSYFVNKVQPLVSDVLYFNSPLIFSDGYCGFLSCSKINTKSTFIFAKNDDIIMGQTQTCNGLLSTQYDAINYCSVSENKNIKIMIMNPGYYHSPFGDNNNIALSLFLLIANGGGLSQPNPTCQSDCTFGNTGICTASCSNVNDCTNFRSACSNVDKGIPECVDNYNYATCCNGALISSSGKICCNGALISCSGTITINCPSYCNATSEQLCTYPSSTASCLKTCTGGICDCTPSCGSVTCTACPSGTTCSAGTCISIRGGGSPLLVKCGAAGCPNEAPVETPPQIDNTWTIAVIIIALLGLGIGYFILREEVMLAETAQTKKKRRK